MLNRKGSPRVSVAGLSMPKKILVHLIKVRVMSNPGRFGPIPVRSGRFGPGRFGPISGVSRFGPVGAGRFGPIS